MRPELRSSLVCLSDLVSSYACESRSFLTFLGRATYTDLSLVKLRAESRRFKNNSNCTTPLRLLNESGPRGDLSFYSMSFKPLERLWTNLTLNSSLTYKPRRKSIMAYLLLLPHPPRYWDPQYQNYSGRDGKPTLLK